MRPAKRVSVLIIVCSMLGTGSLIAFSPMLFSSAQEWAVACVLVRAQVVATDQIRMKVIRSVFGVVGDEDLVISHPGWLSGSKVIAGHSYLVLLGRDGQPIRTDETGANGPGYYCGVINTLEVVDSAVIDAHLYDVKSRTRAKSVSLAEVERNLRRSHEGKGGV